jgi:hypothetical protein
MSSLAALLLLLCGPAGSFLPTARSAHGRTRAPLVRVRMQETLAAWLEQKAGVSQKFLPQVLETCDEQMIGSVANLRTLSDAGMLDGVFKPVIVAGIDAALSGSGAAAAGGGGSGSLSPAILPLSEVKRVLMLEGQVTWGTEADLRGRADMFLQQRELLAGSSWDGATQSWSAGAAYAR